MAWGAIVGSIASGYLSNKGQSSANDANRGMTQNQMNFQSRMRKTQHQDQVTDLRKAGLNPILSANSGSGNLPGANTRIENELEGAANSAQNAAMMAAQIKNIKKDTEVKELQKDEVWARTMQAIEQSGKNMQDARYTMVLKRQAEEILKGLKIEGDIDDSKLGRRLREINRIMQPVTSAIGAGTKLTPRGK